MLKNRILFLCLIGGILFTTGCTKQVLSTTIVIEDPVRHYYPILQGQELDLVFSITNTGDNPLIVNEVQPSCGCIVANRKSRIIVPAGGVEYIRLTYNSNKNVGYVAHTIRLFGNILPYGTAALRFDVNVVPNADYTRDYEELFRQYNLKNGIIEEAVNGKESQRSYYTHPDSIHP